MRILISGGTRFVGRHITEAALAAGHEVTLLHRGVTGADLFPQAAHVLADRDGDLSGLAGGEWDATVDVNAYLPGQVRSLAAALDGRGGRYVFISSVSAYAVPAHPGYTEDSPLLPAAGDDVTEVTGETYGPLKVGCEHAAVGLFGDGTMIVRPTYVVGPYDPLDRFTHWVRRIALGGQVLAPGDPADPIQIIDAQDMAAWIVAMLESGGTGAFHAVSARLTWGGLLDAVVAEVGPPGTALAWVPGGFLAAAGETGESLPLWPGADPDEMLLSTASPDAVLAAGLRPRSPQDSARDVLAAEGSAPTPVSGRRISAEREAELLALWAAR